MTEPKTRPTGEPVEDFLGRFVEPRRTEARALVELMQEVTGEPPVVWGGDIVGFGQYAQRYADGRQVPWPLLAFSPRAKELSIYVMDGFDGRQALLAELGRHRAGKSCLYLRRLSDASPEVLRRLLAASAATLEPLRIR
ncbi:hypothetical protein MNQ95_14595 [Pseudoxanthomonas daejeonensis]|uniref:DUF1801 domain-containing protein n=1 Tax=Pseudoxanthomonas daejeonensis TaxID=266062 RepID=UPI001F545249|nr:DUF1801 domain-containing protein [Pseudoxanthomonas daejeonensis]UNK57341.1 hypothetical protein MNQ95_14595 [Pseudoxanthomonas daejeonensis]